MKMKIIKKFLASLIIATTMMGTMSSAASDDPRKLIFKSQNIYNLNECDKSYNEHVEEEHEQQAEQESEYEELDGPTKDDISKFNRLLDSYSWSEFELGDFLEICIKLSYYGLLRECPLEKKLKTTEQLTKCANDDDIKGQIAAILLDFSRNDFFKEYDIEQKLDITNALIDCSDQEDAKEYVVNAFLNLCLSDFFEGYSASQKAEIAKILIGCLKNVEFNNNVIQPLAKILNAPDVLEKLNKYEQDQCAHIMAGIQI